MSHIRLLCFLLVLLLPALSPAEDFNVTDTADKDDTDPGNGVCFSHFQVVWVGAYIFLPKCTLRAAIQEAEALPGADSISLKTRTYTIDREGNDEDEGLFGDFDVTDSLTIIGTGSTIDTELADRIFDVHSGTLSLSNMTLSKGQAKADSGPAGGGAIRNQGSLYLDTVELSDNSADAARGGAILNLGNAVITNGSIRSNRAGSGGGIHNSETGSLKLRSSTLSYNTADFGGGLSNAGSGGLVNVTLSNNAALSTVSHSGGGICNTGKLELVHTTLAANIAAGGAENLANSGEMQLSYSLISNGQPNCFMPRSAVSNGHNIESGASCGLDPAKDIMNINPEIGPLAQNGGSTLTHALPPGSPALDIGSSAAVDRDQRGIPRPQGRGFDAGAYELSYAVFPRISPVLILSTP